MGHDESPKETTPVKPQKSARQLTRVSLTDKYQLEKRTIPAEKPFDIGSNFLYPAMSKT